jgi:hypothetical protein
MSNNTIFVLMYRYHKLLDLIQIFVFAFEFSESRLEKSTLEISLQHSVLATPLQHVIRENCNLFQLVLHSNLFSSFLQCYTNSKYKLFITYDNLSIENISPRNKFQNSRLTISNQAVCIPLLTMPLPMNPMFFMCSTAPDS